ncbi:hypothetical protein PWT90_05013 [Aphanocladium album]|nr:hypothetical protein PWT90_05013 [Aphanocladium album]
MSAPDNAEYELLTEHFSYPPVSLLDDIINAVNVLADRALGAIETTLTRLPAQNLGFGHSKKRPASGADPNLSPEEAAKREIENGTHQLETLLNASIDKNFDIFELYVMNNILTVKRDDQPFMQLAHYKGLDFFPASTSADDATAPPPPRPTLESVTQLRRRLHASQQLHVALETERVRNDALLKKLRAALGVAVPAPAAGTAAVKQEEDDEDAAAAAAQEQTNALGFLTDRGTLEEGGTVRPITTTTEFTLSQLQTLRSLSSSLRTLLPAIGGSGGEDEDSGGDQQSKEEEEDDDDGAEKSWRRERAEYVEGASRRYLETVAGVELGPGGEVRDGEWQGAGRGITRGEVEGLEEVVAVLGAQQPAAAAAAEEQEQQQQASGETQGQGQDESMDQS